MNNLSQAMLCELLDYDPSTGSFHWKKFAGVPNQMEIGQVAGWHDRQSRSWKIEIAERPYLAHRLAWFYIHGVWPKQIDHINGDRMDNRLCNLRNANNSQNQANMKAKSNNRLGIRGISFTGRSYLVQIKKDGKAIRALFPTLAEAELFTKETHKKLHGEFSIHNRPHGSRVAMR